MGFLRQPNLRGLPGYAPKGDHDQDEEDRKVRRLLKYGYERSVALLALGTPNYGRPTKPDGENWTLREWSGDVSPSTVSVHPYHLY